MDSKSSTLSLAMIIFLLSLSNNAGRFTARIQISSPVSSKVRCTENPQIPGLNPVQLGEWYFYSVCLGKLFWWTYKTEYIHTYMGVRIYRCMYCHFQINVLLWFFLSSSWAEQGGLDDNEACWLIIQEQKIRGKKRTYLLTLDQFTAEQKLMHILTSDLLGCNILKEKEKKKELLMRW